MTAFTKWLFVQFIFAFVVMISIHAKAEYRVFELEIVNDEKGTAKKVISTLDNNQYPILYPVGSKEYVRYVTSWMCWGSTNDKKPCPRPDQGTTVPTAKNPSST